MIKKRKKKMNDVNNNNNNNNNLDEQVFPRELQAILTSLPLWDSWECFILNNADFAFLKPLTHLV